MELKLSIIQDPYRGDFIVTFDGLPGCMCKDPNLSNAISKAYQELDLWYQAAQMSGFDCFKSCLYINKIFLKIKLIDEINRINVIYSELH